MLVLRRKIGQRIRVGNSIRIEVVEFFEGFVWLYLEKDGRPWLWLRGQRDTRIDDPEGQFTLLVCSMNYGYCVNLGIEAPPEINIDREEVFLAKRQPLKETQTTMPFLTPLGVDPIPRHRRGYLPFPVTLDRVGECHH